MNEMYLVPTKFVDINPITGEESETHYGFRLFDDHGRTYTNLLSKEQFDKYIKLNQKEIIEDLFVSNTEDDNAMVMYEYAKRNGGINYDIQFVKFE